MDQVAVVGVDCIKQGQEVCAFVVMRGSCTLEQLQKYCFANIQAIKIPQKWRVVQELPKNQMMKVDKKEI